MIPALTALTPAVSASPAISVTSVAFDSSTTPKGLSRGDTPTGWVDGNLWTSFMLFRPRGDTSDKQELFRSGNGDFNISVNDDAGKLVFGVICEAGTTVFLQATDADGNDFAAQNSKFIGLACGYNGSSGNEAFVGKFIREGDSAWTTLNISTPFTGDIDFTEGDLGIWVHSNGTTRPADVDAVYALIHTGVYIDWGADDLDKVYDLGAKKFREIGDDGTGILGATAQVLIKGQAFKTGVNTGSGGNFTVNAHDGDGQVISLIPA